MDGAIGVTVEKAPHAISQLADALRSNSDQRSGQLLIIEVGPAFDGVTEMCPASRLGGGRCCSRPGPCACIPICLAIP